MKVGVRKPNIKKSIKARTIGKAKRKMKKAVNPLYGKKGMGFINNPRKAVYNKVYNKTTIDLLEPLKKETKTNKSASAINTNSKLVVFLVNLIAWIVLSLLIFLLLIIII